MLRTLSLLLLGAVGAVHAFDKESFDYLKTLQAFQQGFVDPAAIMAAGNWSVFSPDIIGRIDITSNFLGEELNTEYVFGLFDTASNSKNTSIVGSPVKQTIQSLVVEPPMLYASVITDFYYSTINFTLPVQMDITMRLDDQLRIAEYDAVFRRWSQAFDYLSPKIAPEIAKEFGLPYLPGNATLDGELIVLRAATDTCEVALKECTGANVQYSSMDECMNFILNEIPFGPSYAGGGNTGLCRYIHKGMVPFRPEVHCPHVGKTGGDMCNPRDYVEVVNTSPFTQSLVAPGASFVAADYKGVSTASQTELLEASLQYVGSTTIAFYSIPTIVLFALFYILARVTWSALYFFYPEQMKAMHYAKRRNTVTYIVKAIVSTIALGLQLVSVQSFASVYTYRGTSCLKVACVLISCLYIFEVTYRLHMRASLLAHHFLTLLAIISIFVSLESNPHPATATLGVIWLFQATTEQSILLGMVGYRLKFDPKKVRMTLRFAAVQTLVVKLGFAIFLLVWWGQKLEKFHKSLDIYSSVIVVTVAIALLATQVYGSYAVWSIGERRFNKEVDRSQSPQSVTPDGAPKSAHSQSTGELEKVVSGSE